MIEENKITYNKIAKHFSDTRSYVWDDLKSLSIYAKNGDEVLDVGCGNGRLIQLFANTHITYTGIDQSEGLITIAKAKYPERIFVVGGMENLPFDDESFDVIYCIAAFHHLPNDEMRIHTLQEMKRVLKSGGMVVMMNWNLDTEWARNKIVKKDWRQGESREHFIIPWKDAKGRAVADRHYWSISAGRMDRLCTTVGLEVEKQFYTKRGEKVEKKIGENMVSVIRKK